MANYTPTPLTGDLAAQNTENEKISLAINSKVDRNPPIGQANQMERDFDMNSYRILNHPAPINPTDLVRAKDLDGLLPEGNNLLIVSNTENVVLTEAQTVVVFSDVTTTQTAYYISGVNVDQGRLSPTVDYSVTNSTTITLTSTFPTGTIITAVQNEGAGEILSDVRTFDNVAVMKAANLTAGDTALCLRYYAGGDLVDGLLYEAKSSGTTDGYIDHDCANGIKVFLVVTDNINPKQAGVKGDGTTNDLPALRAIIASGLACELDDNTTYLLQLAASEDAGNDMCLQFASTTSNYFVGKGRNTVFKLDSANTFNGTLSAVIGLDLREATGGKFTIGGFTVDCDKSNAPASQVSTGVRFQNGTAVTATNYEVYCPSPIWVNNAKGVGITIGVDCCEFTHLYAKNCDDHGVSLDNASGDGRLMRSYGQGVYSKNCEGLALNYSGGSQVNGGPMLSYIDSVDGDTCAFGSKLAGSHTGGIGQLTLKSIGQGFTANSDSAFYTNDAFNEFWIGQYTCDDATNGCLSHAETGKLFIERIVSRNNNSSSNGNGDVVQSTTGSVLHVVDYDGVGHASSTRALNVLDGEYTKVGISKCDGFDSSQTYPLNIETNGFAEITSLNSAQDNNLNTFIMRLDSQTTGRIIARHMSFTGSKAGHGPRVQGSGYVSVSDSDCSGFAQNNIDDSGKLGEYSNVKGFQLTYTTTELESVTNLVNTSARKVDGFKVWNTTTNKPVYSTGDADASTWVDSAGVIAHTPV